MDKENIHPGKIVSSSQEVEVVILEIDYEKKKNFSWYEAVCRESMGKICRELSHWLSCKRRGKKSTEFGLFVGLEGDLDGMIHLSDLDWNEKPEVSLERHVKERRSK